MEKVRNIILNIINNTTRIFFIVILIILTLASIFSSCSLIKDEKTIYLWDNWFINILSIVIFIGIIVFFKKKEIKIGEKKQKILLRTIILIWICLAFVWVFTTQFSPKADQKYIYKAALGISDSKYGSFFGKGYINQNPQQEGMVLFDYLISLISKNHALLIIQIVNIFALLISFYAIYKITDLTFESNKISKITLVSLLLFVPIFFYITFMYGNILGLALSMIGVLYEIKYFKKRKWYFIPIAGLSIALAIIIKSNYLIMLIAMIIMFFVDMLENKKARNILFIIGILVVYLCISFMTKCAIKKLTGAEIADGIPMVSYIAMGMQEGSRAPGWYNGYNRKVYKKSNYNYEEAKKQSIEDIKKRLEVFKNNPIYMAKFYTKKILSQWNNPTFQGFWVNGARKSNTEKPWYVNRVIYKGKVNKVITEYMNIMQTIILFGAVVYIILDYKQAKGNKLFLMIIFIGGFLFHIIWEAKCQYTITYFILLIPYSVKGYDILTNRIEEFIYYEKILKRKMLEDKTTKK